MSERKKEREIMSVCVFIVTERKIAFYLDEWREREKRQE